MVEGLIGLAAGLLRWKDRRETALAPIVAGPNKNLEKNREKVAGLFAAPAIYL